MKILIDARMFGLEHSGIGRYLINLVEELKKLRTEKQFVILLRKKYFDELNLPRNWKKVLADFGHYGFEEQFKLPYIISKLKPDLVHFPHFNIPFLWKGNFVVTIHDMTIHKQGIDATSLSLPLYFFKRILYNLIFQTAVFRSKKIITPSKTIKIEVTNYYKINPSKVVVIYEGFNLPYVTDGVGLRDFEILNKFKLVKNNFFFYVGKAYPHKNLRRAIQAICDINKYKGKPVQFVIAGSRDVFMYRLEKFVKESKTSDFVRFLGFVSDDELKVLYKYSLGFVYPSLSEGFGLQGLEAIASGSVLLCSDIPVFREIYKKYAFYFNPLDLSSISSTIYFVMNMRQKDRSNYITKSQEYIKRYSWQRMTKETFRVYNQVLKGKKML